MFQMDAIVYDAEICNLVPPKDKTEPRLEGLRYCEGWADHQGMGIAVVGAYDLLECRYRIFLKDNLIELHQLMQERNLLVGFNNTNFDNKLLAAHGVMAVTSQKSYDLMLELAQAAGNVRWCKLDEVCQLNFGPAYAKKITGDMAPVLWQRGEIGKVIDYCLDDIRRSLRLFEQAMTGQVKCVKTGRMLTLRKPDGVKL